MLDRLDPRARGGPSWHGKEGSPYEVLGVEVTASPEAIRRAYRDLIQVWHPDRFSGDPERRREAERVSKLINQAHAALTRPRRARTRSAQRAPRPRPATRLRREDRSTFYWEPLQHSQHARIGLGQMLLVAGALLAWLVGSVLLFYLLEASL